MCHIRTQGVLLDNLSCRSFEMGAHFFPCIRFLVAGVACLLPQTEGDQGSQLTKELESAKRIIADLQLKLLKKTADAIEPKEKQPEDNCCITKVPTSGHEERLPEGDTEADVDMCGGLNKQEQERETLRAWTELP